MFKNIFPYVIVLLIGVIFLFLVEPNNLGVSHDSVYYLEMAKNLLEGEKIKLSTPEYSSFWPLGYPMLLCLSSFLLNMTLLKGALYLNFSLLLLFGFFFIKILKALDANYTQLLILPVVLFISTPLTISRMVWSELAFFVILFSSILFIIKFINNSKSKYLIYCGLLSGLSFFVRFSTAGFIGGLLLFLIIFNKQNKLKSIIFYVCSVALVYFLGTFICSLMGQYPASRTIDFMMINPNKIKQSIFTFIKWFVNKDSILSFFLGSAFLGILLIQIPHFKKTYELYSTKIQLLTTLIVSYYSFLIAVLFLFGDGIEMNNRMLSSIFVLFLLLFSILYKDSAYGKYINKLTPFLLVFCVFFSSYEIWENHYSEGKGYTSKKFNKYPDFVSNVIKENPNVNIYSNAYDFITYLTGDRIYLIPLAKNIEADTKTIGISDLKCEIKSKKALLLFSNSFEGRSSFIKKQMVLNVFKDYKIEFFFDGFIIK